MASAWRARLDETRRTLSAEWLLASVEVGFVAGVVAGASMPVIAMLEAIVTGGDVWRPPEAVVEMFFGELHAGADVEAIIVVTGSITHLLLSAVFGVMFALITGVTRRSAALPPLLLTGVAWGLGRWGSNTYLVAPRLAGGQLMTAAMPQWTWIAGHVLYGLALGLLYARWRQYIPFDEP